MKKEKKYYISLIFLATIIYGIGVMAIFAAVHKIFAGILSSIVTMMAFFLVMSFILNYRHFRWIDKYMQDKPLDDFNPSDKRELTLSMDKEKAHHITKQILIDQRNLKISDENKNDGMFLVTYGASWNEWGEIILIKLSEQTSLKTKIEIYSRRAYKTQRDISQQTTLYIDKIVAELNRHDLLNVDMVKN